MSNAGRDDSLGEGVLYHSHDCAGFFRRFCQMVIDAVSIFLLAVLSIAVIVSVAPLLMSNGAAGFVVWLLTIIFYLLGLKVLGIPSVGYWLTGCRVVDLRGQRPAVWRLVLREGFVAWSLGLFLFDLAWCGMNPDRRSLRDCIFGTMVVRRQAQPCSQGPIHLRWFYFANMYTFVYPVVSRPVPAMERSPSVNSI